MSNYAALFKQIRQFIIEFKLDSDSNIEGATKSEIENVLQRRISDIPEAYVIFLEVFGNQHNEVDFNGVDFVLDSREYDTAMAVEINPVIASSPENIVIALAEDDSFFYITTESDNPKVCGCSKDALSDQRIQSLFNFTTFIRELPFQSIEKLRRQKERLQQISNQQDFVNGKIIDEQVFLLRNNFLIEIDKVDTSVNVMSLDYYQNKWNFFFDNSDHYVQNKDYYKRWGKPFHL